MSLYYCDICRMYTKSGSWYETHLRSARHIRLERDRTDYQLCIENQCFCGRIFSKKAYYDRHHTICRMKLEKAKAARKERCAEIKRKREEEEQERLAVEKLMALDDDSD